MVKNNYYKEYIELSEKEIDGKIIPITDWILNKENIVLFNTINDITVNGIAIKNDNNIRIYYEDISQLDEFERSILNLPKYYPYDIFIDIEGSGLKDINLKIKYSFQDFAHNNGSGNILFKNSQLNGAYLSSNIEYILNSSQFKLIREIELINSSKYSSPNELLKAIANLQSVAIEASAILSKVLLDTIIIAPNKLKIDIEDVGNNRYKLKPLLDNVDNSIFQRKFEIHSKIKNEYSYKKENKKIRVVISNTENEDNNSINTELNKLKEKNTFSLEEINEIYNTPTKFWDTELIDLDEFGARVIELGIYHPKFYPFISPYKSEWIPGIYIDDKVGGSRKISIKNNNELIELKNLVSESKAKGENSIIFKGEEISLVGIAPIIENAEKQLKTPKKQLTTQKEEAKKSDDQTKVIIINDNIEHFDYSETERVITDIKYNFQSIDNLSSQIQLKEHQVEGVAWLQTLSRPPYSLPGVLLADDMGLGKTLQVLYFVEWYCQNINTNPVLVVAPVSLLENWQNEYLKFFPKPSYEIVTLWGSNVRNYIIPNDKDKTINNLSKKSIFFTTYETLRKQQIPLGLIDWSMVILDEAQKIKTPGTFVTNASKALKSDFKIAMTGTPVENTLMDLWCIIDFCSPGLLENAKDFSIQFQKPLKKENTDFKQLSENLRGRIGDTLLRRMKTDVAKDLPTIEYIKFEEIMPSEQFNIYLNELSEIEKNKENSEGNNTVLQGIFNLKSISDHPYLKHYQVENIETKELINASAKLKKVISIIEQIKNQEEKVIVFTENKSMQRILRRVFAEQFEINASIINGETPTNRSKNNKTKLSRQQEIDKFQLKNGFNIIIMSPIAAGFGLNVTEANHIIHYTRHWNPAKEQQATDRAYRIGQKKPVKVYYPLAVAPDNKIETFDIILDNLLSRKSNLASSTLFPTEQIEISKDEFINSIGISESNVSSIKINNIESLDNLQPLVFEAAIALLLEKLYGGNSWLTPKTNDKGADIMHFNDRKDLLIQVKQSKSKLGISSGQEISYALPEYNKKYDRKFKPQIITNSYFNQSAIDLAKQHKIDLIDRDIIRKWISNNELKIEDIDKKLLDRK